MTDVFLELSTANCLSRLAVGAALTVNVGGAGCQQAPVCEPLQVGDGTGVAIHGHMNGEGKWFGSPNATPVCDATRQHSICGYYRI